jgi:succinate-acetate transporter protein
MKKASSKWKSRCQNISEKLANPAPLGLLAFGLTTVLLNLSNAGFYTTTSMILAMGLAYGGSAQIIAGAMEFKKGNTFGTVAFSSYGFFWWSLVFLIVLPDLVSTISSPDAQSMAAYFFMWGLFTFVMFFGALRANRAIQFVFMSLAILFFMLTAWQLTSNATLQHIAGYEGVICGLSAVYLGLAEVLNEAHGKVVFPIGHVSK